MLSKRQVISCGIVVVRQENDGWKYLMLWSFKSFVEPGGKGKQEVGETNLQTALRETQEETGILEGELDFRWGTDYIETEPYGKQHKINRWFVAETKRQDLKLPVNPGLGYSEHNDYRWLPYEEARSLLNARLQRVLGWAKEKVDG